MTLEKLITTIHGDGPGRTTQLIGYRLGPENVQKKVFLQGALHADEQPGIMALCSLLPKLIEADRNGNLSAEFVVYPMVNPLGMANVEFGMHQGRYDIASGVNFNRNWPDLFAAIKEDVAGKLTKDAEENRLIIREAVKTWLSSDQFTSARMQQRRAVMLEAYDSDYVFDLHCDDLSLVHIFSSPHCNQQMISLSQWIDAKAILTAEDSGGGSFDEVWPLLWINASRHFSDHPFPSPPTACTIELRGKCDVNNTFGTQDANGLFCFFQSEGLIDGDAGTPGSERLIPYPLNATEVLRVTEAGLLNYKVALGDYVETGQTVAELIALEGDQAFIATKEIKAGTDGIVLSMNTNKYVWQGCSIAKIVGKAPLLSRGDYLLED